MSVKTTYDEQVVLAYEGEVTGYVLFSALAAHETSPQARAVWEKVAEVEALTRDRLEPLAHTRHADLTDNIAKAHVRAHERLAKMKTQTWRQIVDEFAPQLAGVAQRAEALEGLASDDDEHAALAQVTAHSRAFADAIRSCLADDCAAAVASLDRYLKMYRENE